MRPVSPAALGRRVPAVSLHFLVALVDFSFAVGEGAVRVAGSVLSLFLGGEAVGNAVEGLVGYVLFGNIW